MYRRTKFLEVLHEIREEMSREADYDMDLFAEMARSGRVVKASRRFRIEGQEPESLTADHEHLTTDN